MGSVTMNDDIERTIIASTSAEKIEADITGNTLRSLSLGVTPLQVGDPRQSGLRCEGCGIAEESAPSGKLLQCKACKMAAYCSAECQKSHWKEEHKAVCRKLTGEAKAEGKRIVKEMNDGRVHSLRTLQLSDAAYVVAKKRGLFPAMEKLFCMEARGGRPERTWEHLREGCYSWTHEIIRNIFKGNREVVDRFTCACPVRSKEYILSSSTAWDNLMDAMLHLARVLNEDDFSKTHDGQEAGLSHRAARDAFVTVNLALVHKKVAKAVFSGGGTSQSDAREYALNTMAPKLKAFYRNGGEGFAPDHIDHNQTVRANIHQFTAMLSYWYRAFEVDPANPNSFIESMELDALQEMPYELLARPMGEGMIELGRTLTVEETRERSLKANKEYQEKKKNAKRAGKKKGKGKKNRR